MDWAAFWANLFTTNTSGHPGQLIGGKAIEIINLKSKRRIRAYFFPQKLVVG
jgi:hypothetical protein